MKTMYKILLLAVCLFSVPSWATSYFMSTSGSDGNNGLTTGTPWLTPLHALNCGDTITAASGTYLSTNLNNGKWGAVTCPAGNNVAWLICATFDTCKVNSTTGTAPGIWIDSSYWGIQGFEVTVASTVTFGACFEAGPASTTTPNHIIFANDIANGCAHGGFITFNNGTSAAVDYVVIIGNIAYNAAQGSNACASGISIYQPKASDTNAGTHFYVAGNYSYANVDPATCQSGPSTDGEAIIFDTFDSSQGGPGPYTQQAVMQNNIGFFNGGRGFEVFNNQVGSGHAAAYVKYNTAYGDMTDSNQTNGCLGRAELALGYSKTTSYDHNLAQTRSGTSCSGGALFAATVETGDSSDSLTNNWYYSAASNNILIDNSPSFVLGGTNTSGTSPVFTNPVNPGAPSCGSFASVVACMATVIADYTPTAGSSPSTGYQAVSNVSIVDPLFPQWLCDGTGVLNPLIPANLITPGCGLASSAGFTIKNGSVTGGSIH